MKTFMLFTGGGPLVILTSYEEVTDSALVDKLAGKGIEKFIAFEIDLETAKQRYGGHFHVVENDLRENDDLRILDYDGQRALKLFRFHEMSQPTFIEAE